MNLSDVHAVIESARSRGRAPLERWVRDRIPEATEADIDKAVSAGRRLMDSGAYDEDGNKAWIKITGFVHVEGGLYQRFTQVAAKSQHIVDTFSGRF